MNATLPSDLESFVESQVNCGRFASASDVIVSSLRLFQELSDESVCASQEERDALRQELSQPDDDIQNGRVRRINSEAESRAFAEEVIARGRAKLEAERCRS